MNDEGLREEINKRLTLNWLIQGAAQHGSMTLHHLVRDELAVIDVKLLHLYDQYALVNLRQWWHFDAAVLIGWPPRFWRLAASQPNHPFFTHPLLSRYGGMLAAAERQRALDRSKEKGVTRNPLLFPYQTMYLRGRIVAKESTHRQELIELAKKSAAMVWGIPVDRFDADLTKNVAFGKLSAPRSIRGSILRSAARAYGSVMRRNDSLVVVARAGIWQMLAKELVKGTAELICLHGLNNLSDDTYRRVMDAADRIEFEPWMLQTGGELWRRLLAVVPDGRPIADILMRLARLPAKSLEPLMLAVIEQPEWARELVAGLGDETGTEFKGSNPPAP